MLLFICQPIELPRHCQCESGRNKRIAKHERVAMEKYLNTASSCHFGQSRWFKLMSFLSSNVTNKAMFVIGFVLKSYLLPYGLLIKSSEITQVCLVFAIS